MKTKIKFVIFTIIVSLLFEGTQDIHAAWYASTGPDPAVNWTPYGAGVTNCPTDGQNAETGPVSGGFFPNPGNAGMSYTAGTHYIIHARVNGSPSGFMMPCQMWDSTNPTITTITYGSGWFSNPNIVLNFSSADGGGAGMWQYDIQMQYSDNSPSFIGGWTSWVNIVTNYPTTNTSFTYNDVTRPSTTNRAYKFQIRVRDKANNASIYSGSLSGIYKLDTTAPDKNNLTISPSPSVLGLLATNSQPFNLTFTDPGAPVKLTSQIVDFASPASWITILPTPTFANTFLSIQNISQVDNNRIADSFTARLYTYRVTQICDEAGNCSPVSNKDFNYNVYANPIPVTPFNTKTDTSLTSGSAIADGTPYTFIHSIKDVYGNAIIPAPGISRIVSMNLSGISNTMFLNQYSRSASTSVFLDNNTSPLNTSGGQGLGTRSSSNGDYPLPIFVYTPTASGYITGEPISDPDATFGFTSNLVVSDTIGGAASFPQTLANPSFKPLYTTAISGNLRDGGFIEGTEQESSILTTNNNLGLTPPLVSLQLEFSGAISPSFNMYGGSATNSNIPIASRNTMVSNPGITYTLLYTKLLQKPNTLVNNLSNLQFSTHFSYMLDGKNIIYNSDIIGKAGYHAATSTAVGNQVGVKVIGPIASNSITALTNNQFGAETSIFSGLSRATVKNNMKQSIALATRNMIYTAVTDTIIDVSSLPTGGGGAASGSKIDKGSEGSIIKLEKNGGFVTLGLTTGISGKRTLVIKGADLYIDKDMYYSSMDPNAILGVVVQKNDAGQGGNLYINPSVTNIVGTYIIDGSIISSNDGANPIGTSNIFTLRHQLYIYGSIVSENTIGGSRMNPPKCPSLMNTVCNTAADAQPYDLNYLRRYYLFGGVPFGGSMTKVIGGAGYVSPTGGPTMPPNSNLIQKFTSLPSPYAAHPVIIEYNPRFRANPPIGFDQMTD